ncbi:MAG: hypothetical protein Q4A58_00415 [Fusobacterium sp.]|uniref:hypothetical protein n=1 Tax=Fusobacterium sp. TaxID=68766 RepID=UPI0026DA7214|nr:hypothetical protein [Fusobacterium sp.]MDO4689751.1 hypothetical protein [Fusobacterium sp.]
MKKKLLLVFSIFLICSFYIFGVKFPEKSQKIEDFIPKDWKLISDARGDLNKDKLEDVALLIEKDDLANIKSNEEKLGPLKLNLNPRILLVLFREKDGMYSLKAKNDKGFIASEHSDDNPTLEDTFSGMDIRNNTLSVAFSFFTSAGTYGSSNSVYIFRFQNKRIELIGMQDFSFMRNSGDGEEISINFSTGKYKLTKGLNVFSKEENKPKVTWGKLKSSKKYSLEEMEDSVIGKIYESIYN